MTDQVWTKEAIHDLLDSSPKAVVRAILAIYARQTEDEKAASETREHNSRGFSAYDAPFLSDIAKKLPKYNYTLTPKQLAICRNKIKRYWRQLQEVAKESGKVVPMKAGQSLNIPEQPVLPKPSHPLHGIF